MADVHELLDTWIANVKKAAEDAGYKSSSLSLTR